MNMYEKILDNLQELVYIADMETYELLYYNKALADAFHIPQRLRGTCYEILQGRQAPCPFCTNDRISEDGCYVWKFHNQHIGRHFILSDSVCECDNRRVRTEIATDITEYMHLQDQLDRNLSLQNFINHCARKLYRQDADISFLIDDVLAAIGDYLQADRAYIFEFCDDVVRNTFEWCRKGVVPQKRCLTRVPVRTISRWMPNFYAHQPILITDLESLRTTSPEEYAVLKQQDIHSLLVFPLWNGKTLAGFVGVDNLEPARMDSTRVLLSSMKFFLSSALWRRDSLNELHFLSYHDQLTGVFNRNAFQRDVQQRDADMGIIFLDINGLKDINDGEGYSVGDAVLTSVSRSVGEILPDVPLYRMGDDEFVLLWQGTDEHKFRQDVERLRIMFSGSLGFSASVGCAWVRREDDLDKGLIAADARMFAAKRDFYRSLPQSGRYRSRLDDVLDLTRPGRLDELLASGSFILYCQPQFRVTDGTIAGGEVLLRLVADDKVIPPSQFIPVLESIYAMPQVDLHVFGEVCACLRRWLDAGQLVVPMAVNFSRTTLIFPEVADRLEEIRQKFAVPAELLRVEVTETASAEDADAFQEAVGSIRNKGFQVAIDDFGVAYANLLTLAHVEFDELKLDKSLMDDLCDSDKIQRLLRLAIEAAADMGIRAIAEGVETEGQLDILRRLDCPLAQGYLFSPPMPMEQFASILPA
ncbi:sensor domain-containing phosphodiesterase [uncultured Desulfovibrio sp.]|uniref:sensor domain-containing diguanylate cyclase n=1 Tax=uncultured Desulfovibrio sp. TaxID=167968 RepID=UPI0026176C19|nr:sensor domain-containing phosphodiesterase [uncultured Desulfovibrio sp.]